MDLISMFFPTNYTSLVLITCLFLATTFFLAGRRPMVAEAISKLVMPVKVLVLERGPGGQGIRRRRGLSIHLTDHALARRVLVQKSAAFLEHPPSLMPSAVLSRNRHCNVFTAPYGAYWRATRRNMVAGVLHPLRLGRFQDTRRRALGDLVRALGSGGAPAAAGDAVRVAVYSVVAEMCFGRDVVAKLGDDGLHAFHKSQYDLLLALPSLTPVVMYPRLGRILRPSLWRRLLGFQRQRQESFLPLIAEVKNSRAKRASRGSSDFTSYVETLLDLRVRENGSCRKLNDGEVMSLMSEFIGAGSDSTSAAIEWTLANLIKHPEVQRRLRDEVDAAMAGRDDGAVVEEGDLLRMPYLRAVVLESLRRHPTVPFVMRRVEGEKAAGALGVPELPRGGATANFILGKIHRDPAVWSDPTSFSPERFLPGGEGGLVDLYCRRKEIKMMPFGAGKRMCPGLAAAMLHLEYFVANLVREFEWSEADGDEVDFTEFHGLPFTPMSHPLRARLVPRGGVAAATERSCPK